MKDRLKTTGEHVNGHFRPSPDFPVNSIYAYPVNY